MLRPVSDIGDASDLSTARAPGPATRRPGGRVAVQRAPHTLYTGTEAALNAMSRPAEARQR